MKKILFICFLLINQINLKQPSQPDPPPGPPPPPGPGPINYDYSDYQAIKINEEISGGEISSTNPNESVVYVNETGTINDPTIIKESGETSNIELCEFFGVNAAILVQNGNLKIDSIEILTKVNGDNAIVATNHGNVTISNSGIKSSASRSSRGLHSTYGGNIQAKEVQIYTQGGSCTSLATDRGEGVVTCESCILSTEGAGSPLIYSIGKITVSETSGDSEGAQAIVIEGGKTQQTLKKTQNLNVPLLQIGEILINVVL